MIDIKDLTEKDKGRWVIYQPDVGSPQVGKIKSWNDVNIFVVYHCAHQWDEYYNYTAAATPGERLRFAFSYVREQMEKPAFYVHTIQCTPPYRQVLGGEDNVHVR